MKFGLRKMTPIKSLKASTTGKIRRSIKSSINPIYCNKGIGFIKNPRKSLRNKIYHKTSFSIKDIFK